jgi:uncharacterized membrane protein (DUF4010 family)
LIVTDYRAAAADSWAVYAQFDSAQVPAVISIAKEDGAQLKVSQAATKIISKSQAGIAQTKASLANSRLKISRKQVRSIKDSSQGMVTWTLADTAGSQD